MYMFLKISLLSLLLLLRNEERKEGMCIVLTIVHVAWEIVIWINKDRILNVVLFQGLSLFRLLNEKQMETEIE